MPYNRYQPQGGIDQGQAEWLGGMAYNPYSSGTDWGFTLRNTLNNLLGHKQMQDAASKEQQRYDAEQTAAQDKIAREERKFAWEKAAEERRLKDLEKPPNPTEKDKEIELITKANPTWSPGQVYNKVYGIKTDAEIAAEKAAETANWKDKEHYSADMRVSHPSPTKPEDTSWKVSTRQQTLLNTTILRKNKEKSDLLKQRTAIDKSGGLMSQVMDFDINTGEPKTPRGRAKAKQLSDIDNKMQELDDHIYELSEFQGGLSSGTPLDESQLSRFDAIVRGIPKDSQTNLMDVVAPIAKKAASVLFGGGQTPQQAPSPIAPPSSEPDPDLVQTTARDIIDRQAKKGITVSEEDGVALAIEFLKSQKNAPR
jgi:hypothetical protein